MTESYTPNQVLLFLRAQLVRQVGSLGLGIVFHPALNMQVTKTLSGEGFHKPFSQLNVGNQRH